MIDYPNDDYVEIRWYDASSEFTGEAFNRRQEVIAGVVERCGRSHILIDAVQFGMSAEEMDIEWRDANTTPRFNAAGIKKQAIIVPVRPLPARQWTATALPCPTCSSQNSMNRSTWPC